jgi:hypothetical protein
MKWVAGILLASLMLEFCAGQTNTPSAEYQRLYETRHYVLTLSRQFEDRMWVNYKGALFNNPINVDARIIAGAIGEARTHYTVLTNTTERRAIVTNIVVSSGLTPENVRKLLPGSSAHGPGSTHVAAEGLEDPPAVSRATPASTCTTCHTEQHSDTFQYEAYLRDILGPGHGAPARTKLGDGPTGHTLRTAALARAKQAGQAQAAGVTRPTSP